MSAVDILRDALFGTPPSAAKEPSREGVLAAFENVVLSLNTLAGGVIGSTAAAVYAARSTLNGHLEFADRTLGLVYNDGDNTGIYIKSGAANTGSWVATGLLGRGPGPTDNQLRAILPDLLPPLLDESIYEATAEIVADAALTRDPWKALQDKLGPYLYGKTASIVNAKPVTTLTTITIATVGNSHGTGQGTIPANQPGEQLKAVIQDLLPEVDVTHQNYAVPGSWQTQMGEQIDKMVADGFKPDIALILDPANDGITSIYHALEGPIVYRDILASNIKRLQAMGAVVLNHTCPLPHPTRSLANGRFDFSPDFFTSFPTTSWVAGAGYQGFTFNAANRTIASTTVGQFTIFSPGWVVPGQWIRFEDDASFHRITAVDSTGTILTVDNGSGGASFTQDRFTTSGARIARIDAKTQLVPARNNDDLSRPAGVPDDVTLTLERRDINDNGILILASVRHLSLNAICREVTAQQGAVLADWAAALQPHLTSDADYDTWYPNDDDFHMGNDGYQLLTPIYREIVAKIAFGHEPAASGDGGDTSGFDARIRAAQLTANGARAEAAVAKEAADEALSGLAVKAPLASPALTGVPTGPTASPGTMTDQLANTYFVMAALNAMVDGAPGALDTLNELAAAMGNDPNFAATMTNLIAQKQPLLGYTPLSVANNLSDLADHVAARANLMAAMQGANSDITEIKGLTTPLSVSQGGTGVSSGSWISYTPTYSTESGALAVAYRGGRYKKIGNTVHLTAHLRPVFLGDAAGEARVSLPFPAINMLAPDGSPYLFELTGYDEGQKIPLRALIIQGEAVVRITKLDGTSPLSDSAQMYVTGTYEAA